MDKRQNGMTTMGLLLVLTVLGFFAFAVIQMVPVYLENMKMVQTLNQIKTELDGQNPSVASIRNSLHKRVDIEDLRGINVKKDFVIKRSPAGYRVSADYERRKPYVANLYLLAVFEHEVEIVR